MMPLRWGLLAETLLSDLPLEYEETIRPASSQFSSLWPLPLFGLAVAAAVWVWRRRNRGVELNSPLALLHEVAAVHHLDRRSIRLILRIAKQVRLRHPVALLLSEESFCRAIMLSRSVLRPADTKVLEKVRGRVFFHDGSVADGAAANV